MTKKKVSKKRILKKKTFNKTSLKSLVELAEMVGSFPRKINTVSELIEFYEYFLPIVNSSRYLSVRMLLNPMDLLKEIDVELSGEVLDHFKALPVKNLSKQSSKIYKNFVKKPTSLPHIKGIRFSLTNWLENKSTNKFEEIVKPHLSPKEWEKVKSSKLVPKKRNNNTDYLYHHSNWTRSWDYGLQFDEQFINKLYKIIYSDLLPVLSNLGLDENDDINRIRALEEPETSVELGGILPFSVNASVSDIEFNVVEGSVDRFIISGVCRGSFRVSFAEDSDLITFEERFSREGQIHRLHNWRALGSLGDIFKGALLLREKNSGETNEGRIELNYQQARDEYQEFVVGRLFNWGPNQQSPLLETRVLKDNFIPEQDTLTHALVEQALENYFKERFQFVPFFAGPFIQPGVEGLNIMESISDAYFSSYEGRNAVNLVLSRGRRRDPHIYLKPDMNGMIGVSDQSFIFHFLREVPQRPFDIQLSDDPDSDNVITVTEINANLSEDGIRVFGTAHYDLCRCYPNLEVDFEAVLAPVLDKDGNLGIALKDYSFDTSIWIDIPAALLPVIGPIFIKMIEDRVVGQTTNRLNNFSREQTFQNMLRFFDGELVPRVFLFSDIKKIEITNNGINAHGDFDVFGFRPVVAELFEFVAEPGVYEGRVRRVFAETLETMRDIDEFGGDVSRMPDEYSISLLSAPTGLPTTFPVVFGRKVYYGNGTTSLNGFEVIRIYTELGRSNDISVGYFNPRTGEESIEIYEIDRSVGFIDLNIEEEAGFSPTRLVLNYL